MAAKRVVTVLKQTSDRMQDSGSIIQSCERYSFLTSPSLVRFQVSTLFGSGPDWRATNHSKSIRIAIVEDEQELLSLYSNYLRDLGYEHVFGAQSGESLITAIARDEISPEILLIDYRLPGIDGIETARRIVARKPATRVIVITADDSIKSIADSDGFEFLQKPFSMAVLARMLVDS